MPAASLVDVQMGLLASRLADVAYAQSHDILQLRLSGLSECSLSLIHFRVQADTSMSPSCSVHESMHPQWYFARGQLPPWLQRAGERAEGYFLVFRGTASMTDIARDLFVRPAEHCALSFHGGFLSGVRDDEKLHEQLRVHLKASFLPVFLIGHSLGGSLALTLLAANLLPPSYRGSVTAITLGSPAVLYGVPSPGALGRAESARVLCFVNSVDVVPRLLGSPLPIATSAILASSARQARPAAKESIGAQLIATLERYTFLPQTEIILLKVLQQVRRWSAGQ